VRCPAADPVIAYAYIYPRLGSARIGEIAAREILELLMRLLVVPTLKRGDCLFPERVRGRWLGDILRAKNGKKEKGKKNNECGTMNNEGESE
jgi:predicted DNA-binding transcriptional regulator